jgi:metallo-beta-lactamase class B
MPDSAPMIVAAICKLGFKPEDVKIIAVGHAHVDHVGAVAAMKELTRAKIAVIEDDVSAMEDGGKSDFRYAADWKIMGFPPAKVDRVLRDGDTVKLGDVVLTAHSTPGHTRGATTWVTTLSEDGKAYTVVFADGGGFNPGYRLVASPSYPGIADDYRATHHRWELLKPDIWFTPHHEQYDLEGKRKQAETQGAGAWVDPEGYRRFVAGRKREFEDEIDVEMGISKSKAE